MINNAAQTLRSVVATVFLFIALLNATNANAAVSTWVDIEIHNGGLYLKTKVGGVEGLSLIDSGAQINAINSNFLAASGQSYRTGQQIKIAGVYGTDMRRTYHSIPVDLFGSNIDFRGLVDLDLGGETEQLLIGRPFLQLYVFQFDYPNQRMRIITRDSVDMRKLKNVKSRSDLKTGDPIVQVRLNDERNVWLQLDTGSSGGVLIERSVATKRDWLTKYPTQLIEGRGATTTGQMERFTLPDFKIGDFELKNVVASVPPKGKDLQLFERQAHIGSRLKKSRAQSKGILGYDVLKHFVVTIDYEGGHVHLEAPGQAPETTPEPAPETAAAPEDS